MTGYKSWLQAAGYFDGDGTVYFSDTTNQRYKLSLSLVFVDQSADQMKMLKEFLKKNGIATSNVLKRSDTNAHELAVSQFKSVKRALKRMLPHLFKKQIEVRAALDYYENRITGSRLAAVFSAEVEAGRRESRTRTVAIDVPYIRIVGDVIMKASRNGRLRDALGRYRAKLTPGDFRALRVKHFGEGRRICDLTRECPMYARETIRRVLGRGRGYVCIMGIGRVDTTDTTIREPPPPRH